MLAMAQQQTSFGAGISQVELDALCTTPANDSDHSESDNEVSGADEATPLTSTSEILRVKRARAFRSKKVMTADSVSPNYTMKAMPLLQAICPMTLVTGLSQQDLDVLCVDKDIDAFRTSFQAAGTRVLPSLPEASVVETEQAARGSKLSQADLDALCVPSEGVAAASDDGGDDEVLCLRKRTRAYDPEAYAKACQSVASVAAPAGDAQEEEEEGDEQVLFRIRRARAFCGAEKAAALSKEYRCLKQDTTIEADVVEEAIASSTEAIASSTEAEAAPPTVEASPKTPLKQASQDAMQIAIERIVPTPQRKRIPRERSSPK